MLRKWRKKRTVQRGKGRKGGWQFARIVTFYSVKKINKCPYISIHIINVTKSVPFHLVPYFEVQGKSNGKNGRDEVNKDDEKTRKIAKEKKIEKLWKKFRETNKKVTKMF